MDKKQQINDSDIDYLVSYLLTVPFDTNITPEEFGYSNPVLICMDAVLSINRRYYSFVVPRINHFSETYPWVQTLLELKNLIQKVGYEGFSAVWKYNHLNRVKILETLATKFIVYGQEIGEIDNLIAMKNWAQKSSVLEYKTFQVNGIGLATFQYLRMMLGVSTVKPDVHIKKAVSLALNKRVSDLEAIWLVEQASITMGLTPTMVDHNLWRSFASDKHLMPK